MKDPKMKLEKDNLEIKSEDLVMPAVNGSSPAGEENTKLKKKSKKSRVADIAMDTDQAVEPDDVMAAKLTTSEQTTLDVVVKKKSKRKRDDAETLPEVVVTETVASKKRSKRPKNDPDVESPVVVAEVIEPQTTLRKEGDLKPKKNDAKDKPEKKKKLSKRSETEVDGVENGATTNGKAALINGDCEVVKKKIKTDEEDDDNKPGSFKKFRISPSLVLRLQAKGIKELFPVQTSSYDAIYDGFDVIVQSRTGSGKTLSFAIPLIEKLQLKGSIAIGPGEQTRNRAGRSPKILVMAPTRELAKQVSDTFADIANKGTNVLCVYGGTPIGPQERSLRSGVDVLVGTPGRLQDLINRQRLDLSQLEHVILDEVDRMLDMGFADDVDQILQQRYKEGESGSNPQTCLFSATLPAWVHNTAKKYLRADRKHIDLIGTEVVRTSKTVQHLAIQCSYFDRASTVSSILQVYSGAVGRAIVFCETKREVDELALSSEIKIETQVIHGDIPQDKRERVLKGFREGRHRCLIATDVAARGLDIPEIDLVIQCCPPSDVESYIHRSGRTGRAGRQGVCVLLYKPSEDYEVKNVERKAGVIFKRIATPSASDIVKSSAQDAVRAVQAVKETTVVYFREFAEGLLAECGGACAAIDLIAAAIAVISGNSEIKQRSLLSSREGFTTFVFRTNIVMNALSYAWRSLERCISPEIKEKISRMKFTADKMGCVFDVPTDDVETVTSSWKDGRYDTLVVATELPELQQQEYTPRYSSTPRGGGRFGGRGGGRGRGGFNRNGLVKNGFRNNSYGGGGASGGGENAGGGANRRTTFD